ncbi:hypothetical protein L1987_06518 [Smallanthus sonchifolius]|uniref:Uncharacterized protein n=1 Tax=Smallanthus sonchifolius TaxID=185202 RepID=A0ACB9JYD7_9ASTR|nr:hypothetical protein L1987_06518 [Smallanthus sonchifolius]
MITCIYTIIVSLGFRTNDRLITRLSCEIRFRLVRGLQVVSERYALDLELIQRVFHGVSYYYIYPNSSRTGDFMKIRVPDKSTLGIGYNVVPHPFNCNFTVMPQEDEVTSDVSCTSGSAKSVSDSENESVEKKVVENCILVEPDEIVVVTVMKKVISMIIVHTKQKEKRFTDPSLAKPFVKPKSFVNKVDKTRNVVKSMVFVKKDVSESSQTHRTNNPSVEKIFKRNDISQ